MKKRFVKNRLLGYWGKMKRMGKTEHTLFRYRVHSKLAGCYVLRCSTWLRSKVRDATGKKNKEEISFFRYLHLIMSFIIHKTLQ
jgi:hypothetical protein